VISLLRPHSGRSWLLPSLATFTVFSMIRSSDCNSLHVPLGIDSIRHAISSLLQPVPTRPSLHSSYFNSKTVRLLAYIALILVASKVSTSPVGCFYSRFSPVSFRPSVFGYLLQLAARGPQFSILSPQLADHKSRSLVRSSQLAARNSRSLVRSSKLAARNSRSLVRSSQLAARNSLSLVRSSKLAARNSRSLNFSFTPRSSIQLRRSRTSSQICRDLFLYFDDDVK